MWLFGVIEHWNAETLGLSCTSPSAAIAVPPSRPSAMAVRNVFGHVYSQRRPRRGPATRPRQRVPRRALPQPDPLIGAFFLVSGPIGEWYLRIAVFEIINRIGSAPPVSSIFMAHRSDGRMSGGVFCAFPPGPAHHSRHGTHSLNGSVRGL